VCIELLSFYKVVELLVWNWKVQDMDLEVKGWWALSRILKREISIGFKGWQLKNLSLKFGEVIEFLLSFLKNYHTFDVEFWRGYNTRLSASYTSKGFYMTGTQLIQLLYKNMVLYLTYMTPIYNIYEYKHNLIYIHYICMDMLCSICASHEYGVHLSIYMLYKVIYACTQKTFTRLLLLCG